MMQKQSRKINNLENVKRFPAEELFPFLSLNKEDTLLDLGAGVGYISLPFSKHVEEVIALDYDEDVLAHLETKAVENDSMNINTLVSDFKDIQLDNETVDKAVASIALHEVEPLSLALCEIYRVLKNEGVLLCIELEKSEGTTSPRVSSASMKEEMIESGFDIVDTFYPQTKVANETAYIIVARKSTSS